MKASTKENNFRPVFMMHILIVGVAYVAVD